MSNPNLTNATSTSIPNLSSTTRPSSFTTTSTSTFGSASSTSSAKARQYAHLHSQLAQLNAHLADTENLVAMTAVQAQDMRFLGGYIGALFMGSSRVLGEESLNAATGEGGEQEGEKDDQMSPEGK